MRRTLVAAGVAAAALAAQATTAFACGGLVAPDGDVRLEKATTFVAWSGGVEHYVTSFAYAGQAVDVGWIVPLPAIPEKIEAAGRWTLQRLEREVHPPPLERFALAEAGAGADKAIVVEQVQVEALDVSVLKGSGRAVIDWCAHNGFALNQETRDHLLRYAQASPVFMAAKYDTAAAQQRGLLQGDGVPLMLTMRTHRLWVPLEVLANDDTSVNADLFLLTDQRLTWTEPSGLLPFLSLLNPNVLDGATGFTVAKQEPMNDALHSDLARDRGMSWVPSAGWLTYLTLDAPSQQVTYDLAVSADNVMRLPTFASTSVGEPPQTRAGEPVVAEAAFAAAILSIAGAAAYIVRRHRRTARVA